MPLTLEEQTELRPLAEKAINLLVKSIMAENFDTEEEFYKTVKKISAIDPIMSEGYLTLYGNINKIKSDLADWGKDNI